MQEAFGAKTSNGDIDATSGHSECWTDAFWRWAVLRLEIGAAPAGSAVSNRVERRRQPPVHLSNSEYSRY